MVSHDARALTVDITYMRQANWSLLRAGIPLVWEFTVHNRDCVPAVGLMARLSLPGYLDTGPFALPEIVPGACHVYDHTDLTWMHRDFEAAMRLRHKRDARLQVEVGSHQAACPIEVLPPDEWCAGVAYDETVKQFVLDSTVELCRATVDVPPGGVVVAQPSDACWQSSPPLQAATAALVLPQHSRVAEIKNCVVSLLGGIMGNQRVALFECVTGTPEQQTQVVQAVFIALAELYPNAFQDVEKFSLENRSQRIRFPDEAVSPDTATRHGGTCVDFALLACAVLADCGLYPLFLLVGTAPYNCHALVGCWLPLATCNSMWATKTCSW